MKANVMCKKFECPKDIHYKTQTGTSKGKMQLRSRFDTQSEGLGVAFFATGPCLGLTMYIFMTPEFLTHNIDFHLLTASVNAKCYY